MKRYGFRAMPNPSAIALARAVVICAPTPLSDGGGPDLNSVIGAVETVAGHLQRGTLVLLNPRRTRARPMRLSVRFSTPPA